MKIPTNRFPRIKKFFFSAVLFFLPACFLPGGLASQSMDEASLAAFSDPSRIWGNGAERFIEEAYRLCFRTRILGGKVMTIRMPFALDNERDILTGENWGFLGGGKGNPAYLWERIDEILDSQDFARYVESLSDRREKVMIFDLPTQSWSVSLDFFDIARMKAGSYRGLIHRPYVLVSGQGLNESDVYNYLYSIGHAGMDCSGFVWHILAYVAGQGGVDLGRTLRSAMGLRQGADPSHYAGTGFYNSANPQIIAVGNEIQDLRPGDIMLFRGGDGGMSHSAVIQSINFSSGIIRYLQSTDEAPFGERGVHESFIHFDPSRPKISLSDPDLLWTQKRYPAFPGEKAGPFSDDGTRYRAYPELGGGRVVRLRAVSEAAARFPGRN